MSALELRLLALADLEPPPGHARRAPAPAAYRRLKAGIAAFGLVEPLVWNELSGHLIGGGLRRRILAELGAREAPVSVVRLSPARETALGVLLDNPKAQGRYDPRKLAAALADLDGAGELELSGFDRPALRTLRFEPAARPAPDESPPDRVEVTLVADEATFAALSAPLNRLIDEHGLVTHVRRGA